MPLEIIFILAGVALAIALVALAAFFFQQWLMLRRFPSRASTPMREFKTPEILYFEEKLQANYAAELPTTMIKTILSIPHSQDKIILLEDKTPFPNLLRCHSNGWITWRAQLPTSTEDAYTHVEWQGEELKALSASGYLATLDAEKGEIVSYEFEKEAI